MLYGYMDPYRVRDIESAISRESFEVVQVPGDPESPIPLS